MSTCCDTPNPLVRDGASQQQRQPEALAADYVRVDERDLADFLVYAHELGGQLIYFDRHDLPSGDWQSFFANSTPVQIALISKTNTQTVKDTYDLRLDEFLEQRRPLAFDRLLRTLTDLFGQLATWYRDLADYTPLRGQILGLVETNVLVPLRQLLELVLGVEVSWGSSGAIAEFRQTLSRFEATFAVAIEDGMPSADTTLLTGTRFQTQMALDDIFQILLQNYRQVVQVAPDYLLASLSDRADHQPHLALYVAFIRIMESVQEDLNGLAQKHLDFFYSKVLQLPKREAIPDQTHVIFQLAKFIEEHNLEADLAFKGGKDATGVELIYRLNDDIVVHGAQIAEVKGILLNSQESETGRAPENITGVHLSPIANSVDGAGEEFDKETEVKAWLPFGDSSRDRADLGLAIASDVLLMQEGGRTVIFDIALEGVAAGLLQLQLPQIFVVEFSGVDSWIPGTVVPAQLGLTSLQGALTANPPFLGNTQFLNPTGVNTFLATAETASSATTSSASAPPTSSWDGTTLRLVVTLSADAAAVVGFHDELEGAKLETTKPVARIRVRDDALVGGRSPYHYLRGATITTIDITVDVTEVRTLVVQNELSLVDISRPFQPFGSQPKNGSHLYIGNQEVFQKGLTALSIGVERETLSEGTDFVTHYRGYDFPEALAQLVTGEAQISALRNKEWQTLTSTDNSPIPLSLFSANDPDAIFLFDANDLKALNLDRSAATDAITNWNLDRVNGFIRLTLNSEFLHSRYPSVLQRQILASATTEIVSNGLPLDNEDPDQTNRDARRAVKGAFYQASDDSIKQANAHLVEEDDQPILPNEPFTPVLNALSLSYTATAGSSECEVFQLHPFDGYVDRSNDLASGNPTLLPTYDAEGELLLGLSDLTPPIALPLLMQVAEETADTDLAQTDLTWSYLADNEWVEFRQQDVLSDSTNGAISSGIVTLAIPAAITKDNTRLNPDLYWIKASVTERHRAIPNIIGIHTQAAAVTFQDRKQESNLSNDPEHLATPLPASTISKLQVPQPQIKTISQPYPSFGGRIAEADEGYYTRISEHLRHKGRAVTIFDYERLVLDQFPDIYKVRCINHARIDANDQLQELVPGHVTVAVIPDLSQRSTTNDLEPKVNIDQLAAIQTYLNGLSSEWVNIRVVNPRYEAIRADFEVEFKSPFNANFNFYRDQLEQAIIGFLSPWTLDGGADIHFGGKVYRSSIINFVEEQAYVDRVVQFKMQQGDRLDLREVTASSARSILVSSSSHTIKPFAELLPNLPPPD